MVEKIYYVSFIEGEKAAERIYFETEEAGKEWMKLQANRHKIARKKFMAIGPLATIKREGITILK